MLDGIGKASSANNMTVQSDQLNVAGGTGGLLNATKDATESSTAPKFGDLLQHMQSKYGAKTEKPREIKKTLGKDDFLKIMITQMKHQDPTSPFKADQMAAQMAQFASVEQLQNMNQNMAKMLGQNNPLERLAMTNMIGKVVTVDRNRFPHTENNTDPLSFNLPKDAADVKIAIISETGETVVEKGLGPKKAGELVYDWDGLKKNTLPAKTGNYMFRVEAMGNDGKSMQTNSLGQAMIVGVSFEGNEPVFLVGDARRQEKVLLRNIIRVDADGPQPAKVQSGVAQNGVASDKPATQDADSASQTDFKPTAFKPVDQGSSSPNYFTFQKGVGSTNLDPAKLLPEAAAAIAKYEADQQEKGFPNGLHDDEEVSDVKQTNTVKGGEKK
ncbi:MAG: flagellar hook assembly protein FlgD [Bdellovibrionota bacterium]